jgi:hypothetical protein
MQDISDRLLRVEDRLERLLASGWRNAGAEAADLASEADALATSGFEHLAQRLRAVAAAPSVDAALPAIVLAAASCRLLRARLPAATAPPGPWAPLLPAEGLSRSPTAELLLVARMVVADGEAWACVQMRGGAPAGWLLLEPLPPGPSEAATAPLLVGLVARFKRGKSVTSADADPPADGWHPWLRRAVRGQLRWLARYPLGAAGQVERCRLEAADWPTPTEAREAALSAFRGAVTAGKLEADQPVLGTGGGLRLKLLEAQAADAYAWADSAAATEFRAAVSDQAWAVAWCQEGLIAPLALIRPGGLFRQGRLVHLVPGNPEEPL